MIDFKHILKNLHLFVHLEKMVFLWQKCLDSSLETQLSMRKEEENDWLNYNTKQFLSMIMTLIKWEWFCLASVLCIHSMSFKYPLKNKMKKTQSILFICLLLFRKKLTFGDILFLTQLNTWTMICVITKWTSGRHSIYCLGSCLLLFFFSTTNRPINSNLLLANEIRKNQFKLKSVSMINKRFKYLISKVVYFCIQFTFWCQWQ